MYEMMPYINVRTANHSTNEENQDRWFDKKLLLVPVAYIINCKGTRILTKPH